MDFSLTSDQAMIRDTAQQFLEQCSGSEAVRRAMASESGFEPGLWDQVGQELGWCGLHVPEAFGGVGLSQIELALLLEQMGYRLACLPYFSTTALAINALLYAANEDAQQQFLPRLAAGELRATLAWSGLNGVGNKPGTMLARRQGGGYVLDGGVPYVLDGASADLLLVPARLDDKDDTVCLFAVQADAAGLLRRALNTLDQTRRYADVHFNAVQLPASARIDDPGGVAPGLLKVRELARIALAADQLGGAQRCLDLSVAYTQERVQFGRTISSFQAVKHRCAEMMVRVEAARSAVYGAACVAASEPDGQVLAMEAAAAKSIAGDTYFYCAQEAIQLHGGVGFTWEYDPHLYFKRAQASGVWLGRSDELLADLAGRLLDRT